MPVLEPKEQTDRIGSFPLRVREGGSPGTEARVEAPLGDSACSSLPLLSAVAKIHSLHPCLGASQAPEPLTAAAPG